MSTRSNDDESVNANRLPRRSDNQNLNYEELKLGIFQTVMKKGIYDSVKSQLRRNLAIELNPNIQQLRGKNIEISSSETKSNLAFNTINCLIIDHLKSNGLDYTLSVFLPESGTNINKVYSLEDILNIMKISPQSSLHEKLQNSTIIKSKGLLWYLVNYLCQRFVTHDVSLQTDSDGLHSITSNLDGKLKMLDKQYAEIWNNLDSRLSFEEKMIVYQRNLEEKSKKELEEKMREFKENEKEKLRIEEREKQRKDFVAYRLELENQLAKRADALSVRESQFEAMLKEKREKEERDLFYQRQNLLEEIKHLKERESDFKKRSLNQISLSESDAVRIEKLEDDLKKREAKLRQAELDFESRLKEEKERLKIELEHSYSQRQLILETNETKLKQEASQLAIERSQLDSLKHEYKTQVFRLSEIDLELQKCRGECACLKQENVLLKENIQKTIDYDFIKQENKELRQKLEISKEIIGEKQLTSRSYATGRLNERKRSVTFDNEGVAKKLIPILNLNEENEEKTEAGVDSYREEGQRILDEAFESSRINKKLDEQHLVNENLKDLYEMQLYEQRKLHETVNDVKKQVEFLYYGVSMEDEMTKSLLKTPKLVDSKGVADCNEFLESAKSRLSYLDKENERIENSFREYQHKIKSKYYPINDDPDTELRIVHAKKSSFRPDDLDAFLESTHKTSTKVKHMKKELIEDEQRHLKSETPNDFYQKVVNLKIIDEMIKSVPLISNEKADNAPISNSNAEDFSSKRNLKKEPPSDLLVERNDGSKVSKLVNLESPLSSPISRKSDHLKSPSPSKLKDYQNEDSLSATKNKENKNETNLKNYLAAFDSSQRQMQSVDETEKEKDKAVNQRVKIEYSESSSSSSSSLSSAESVFVDNNRKTINANLKKSVDHRSNEDDDDDDFKW